MIAVVMVLRAKVARSASSERKHRQVVFGQTDRTYEGGLTFLSVCCGG